MKTLLFLAGLLLVGSGCGQNTEPVKIVDDGTITVELMQGKDCPDMKRRYVASLSHERTLEIRMQTDCSRYQNKKRLVDIAKLVQPDGRYIFFDPAKVADKILEPGLVKPVEELSAQIIAMDLNWWDTSKESFEFTDRIGMRWRALP